MSKIFLHIAARKESQGIKNKNEKKFLGKPLINWSIDFSKKMKIIDSIIVNSDSKRILRISKKAGANILIKRPKKFSSSKTSKLIAWKYAYKYLKDKKILKDSDIFVDLDCTCPVRSSKDFLKMINLYKSLIKKRIIFDGIFTITEAKKNPYFNLVEKNKLGFLKISKKTKKKITRRQDTPSVFEHVANTYIINPKFLKKAKDFMSGKFIGFKVDKYYSWDIDDNFDFKIAEYLAKTRKQNV